MFFKLRLRRILPIRKITDCKRYLFIAAHTGDIAKAAGGTVRKLANEGKEIKFLITTDSLSKLKEVGDREKDIERLKKEEITAATVLGAREVEFLPYPDDFELNADSLRNEIIKTLAAFKPDIVFIDDLNTDNEMLLADRLTARAAINAIEILQSAYAAEKLGVSSVRIKAIAIYNTVKPNAYVGIRGCLPSKLTAIMAEESMLPKDLSGKESYMMSYRTLNKITCRRNGLKCGKLAAEGFYVVTPRSMHNMPEINF